MGTIESIMTRDVVSVDMDDTLQSIRSIFEDRGFHHLVVSDHGRAVGVISDRDLLRHLSPYVGTFGESDADQRTLERKAHQIMSRGIVHVTLESGLGDATRLMLEHRIGCLPVLDERRRCLGILTWRDVLRWAMESGMLDHPDCTTDTPAQDAA